MLGYDYQLEMLPPFSGRVVNVKPLVGPRCSVYFW